MNTRKQRGIFGIDTIEVVLILIVVFATSMILMKIQDAGIWNLFGIETKASLTEKVIQQHTNNQTLVAANESMKVAVKVETAKAAISVETITAHHVNVGRNTAKASSLIEETQQAKRLVLKESESLGEPTEEQLREFSKKQIQAVWTMYCNDSTAEECKS